MKKKRTFTISFDVVVDSELSDDYLCDTLSDTVTEIIDGAVEKHASIDLEALGVVDTVNFGAERTD